MTNRTTSPMRPAPRESPSSPARPEGSRPAAPVEVVRGQARPRRPVTIWLPDGPQTVREAPEVTREWPVDGPRPGQASPPAPVTASHARAPEPGRPAQAGPFAPAAAAVVLVVAATFAASLRLGLAPLGAGAAAFLAGTVALLAADRLTRRDPADVLARAQNALLFGEDARRVFGRLRGLEAGGRAGLRLRVARRCLERAGRHGRLAEVLRWEAIRWMGRTLEEISKDGR